MTPGRRGVFAAGVGAAVLIGAALIAAGLVGARSDATPETTPAAAEPAGDAALLRGIPQDGAALGSPDAPVTLVEYADLQCPYCARWSRTAFPELVRDYVRTGNLRMVFRGLALVGPDSDTALRSALAAGEQDRLWDVVHLLYANQGPENGGWVTEELLGRIGLELPGLDGYRMLDRRWSPRVERELGAAAEAAERDRISGTPAFMLGATGGTLEPVALTSLDADPLRARLDSLLAR